MLSCLASLCVRGMWPLNDALALASHTVPLSVAGKQRQSLPEIKNGPVFEQWNNFTSKFPKEKTVKLVHGWLPICSVALGNFLLKNSPRIVAIDIGLEHLDPKAAMWFCKHEYAHLDRKMGSKMGSGLTF